MRAMEHPLEPGGSETDQTADVKSTVELAAAIREFLGSQEKIITIVRISKILRWKYGLFHLDPEDLVQETVLRVLRGERKCPVEMDIWVFLKRNLEWIARDELRRRQRFGLLLQGVIEQSRFGSPGARRRSVGPDDPDGTGYAPLPPSHDANPDQALRATETLDQVLNLFADDPVGHSLVRHMALGYEGEELRELVGLEDTKALATKRTFVRRRLMKYFPDGW